MSVTARMIAALEKLEGKAYEVGHVVSRGSRKYKKRTDGTWEPLSDPNSDRAHNFWARNITPAWRREIDKSIAAKKKAKHEGVECARCKNEDPEVPHDKACPKRPKT